MPAFALSLFHQTKHNALLVWGLLNRPWAKVVWILFLGFLCWRIIPWLSVYRVWQHLNLPIIISALLVIAIAALAEVISWGIWLPPPSGQSHWRTLSAYYTIGLFFNQVIPTGSASDVWRWLRLSKQHGKAQVAVSLIMARLLMFVGLLVWVIISGLLLNGTLRPPTLLAESCLLLLISVGSGAVVLSALFPTPRRLMHQYATKLLSKVQHLPRLHSAKYWCISLLFAIISWAATLAAINLFAHGLGIDLQWPIATLGLIVSLGMSWIPWTPNGLGWRDGAFVFVLWHAGVPPSAAVALSIFIDFGALPLTLLGGVLFLWHKLPTQSRLRPQWL